MSKSKIEWTDEVWNPVTGCTKVSQGCTHCYAERMSKRLAGRCGYPKDEPFQVTLHPEKLTEPMRWKKPRKIFVNSMSDLFHSDVPFEFIRAVWATMTTNRQHTYIILTKRPKRMNEFFEWMKNQEFRVETTWANIWLGVSVEDQATEDERIPLLLQTPAPIRFISAEPLLGPIDLNKLELICKTWRKGVTIGNYLDWVICGGESGPGARPMHPDWVRSLRDQCQAAGTKFFFKQWGEYCYPEQMNADTYRIVDSAHNLAGHGDYDKPFKVGKKKFGRFIDGRTWNEMPEVKP